MAAEPAHHLLQTYAGLRWPIYIAHVRHKTTGGGPTHADTHPFARELLGRDYCFAHNGTLHGAFDLLRLGQLRPVGSTDSEHYFCHLLEELGQAGGLLSTPESWRWLHAKLVAANGLGQLNCLLSDGERLSVPRRGGYKGLHLCRVPAKDRRFVDAELKVDLSGGGREEGYVIATRPLSDRGWVAFQPGELILFVAGELHFSSHRTAAGGSAATRPRGPVR